MMMFSRQTMVPVNNPEQTPKTSTVGPLLPSRNQKGGNLIMVEVPKEARFDLPEGRYRARIYNLRPRTQQVLQGPKHWIRICFEVDVPGMSETQNTLAGRSFRLDLNPVSDLRNFLTGFLGKDYFKAHSGQQVSLDALIGAECEVELEHFYGHAYDQPHVIVAAMYPVSPAEGAI